MTDEELMVIAYATSLLFCALGVHARDIKSKKHAVWVRICVTKTVFDTLYVRRQRSASEKVAECWSVSHQK